MLLHYVTDRTTGITVVRDRLGRDHSVEEIDEARRRAAKGDRAAIELLEIVAMREGDEHRMLADCPECAAAMARGEQPITFGPLQPRRESRWARPRWRDVKKRVRVN